MPSERWQRANRIFEQAVELAAEGQGAFLDASCGVDSELREVVERWLRADQAAGGFLSQPLISACQELPRQLGSYELLEKIGEGGMIPGRRPGSIWKRSTSPSTSSPPSNRRSSPSNTASTSYR